MTCWEYWITPLLQEGSMLNTEKWLNDNGLLGWELVTITQDGLAYFKRVNPHPDLARQSAVARGAG
jgi:hypothetical protein